MANNENGQIPPSSAQPAAMPAPPAFAPPPTHGGTLHKLRWIGLVLIIPALVLVLFQQTIPAITTVVMSVRQASPIALDGPFVGLENFARAVNVEWFGLLTAGALSGLLPAIVGYTIGVVIGRVIGGADALWRRIALGIVGAAVITVAPFSYFLGLVAAGIRKGGMPDLFWPTVLFGLGAALVFGVVVGNATMHRRGGNLAAVAAGAVTAITGLALGMQSHDGAQLTGNPSAVTMIHRWMFRQMEFGAGAALSVIMLIVLIVLGVAATVVILLARLRIGVDRGMDAAAVPSNNTRGIVAVAIAFVALVLLVVIAGNWLPHVFSGTMEDSGNAIAQSWGIAGLDVALATLVAALTGVGIGFFQPLGRYSEALLLLFAPWLFVGIAPLMGAYVFVRMGSLDSPDALRYPQVVVVPLVYVFTFLAAALRRREAHGPRAALPLALVAIASVAALLWLRLQELLWPLITVQDPASIPAPVWVTLLYSQMGLGEDGSGSPFAVVTPAVVLIVFALIFAGTFAGLRRIRLSAGSRTPHNAAAPPPPYGSVAAPGGSPAAAPGGRVGAPGGAAPGGAVPGGPVGAPGGTAPGTAAPNAGAAFPAPPVAPIPPSPPATPLPSERSTNGDHSGAPG